MPLFVLCMKPDMTHLWNSYVLDISIKTKNVNMTVCIPSSSVMITIVVEEGTDKTGPVGVTVERLTVNSWSNSRLSSSIITYVAQAVLPSTSPLKKVTTGGDGSLKSSPATERINTHTVTGTTKSMLYNVSRLVHRIPTIGAVLTHK